MKTKRCGNCGQMSMTKQPVESIHWKDFHKLELLKPVDLYKCSACGEVGLSAIDASSIDKAAEATLQKVTQHLIEKILAKHGCSQSELAERLGITETHLSHLKNGSKTIGFQTFNFLKTLALGHDAFDNADPEVPLRKLMAS